MYHGHSQLNLSGTASCGVEACERCVQGYVQSAQPRGVWGHTTQENFKISGPLRMKLMQSGR